MAYWRIEMRVHSQISAWVKKFENYDRIPEKLQFNLNLPVQTSIETWLDTECLEEFRNISAFWTGISITATDLTYQRNVVTIELSQTLESWHAHKVLDSVSSKSHRLTGPAVKGKRTEWWVHGKLVESFEHVLTGDQSWQEYIENKPENIFVILALHEAGLISLTAIEAENLQAAMGLQE